MMATEFGWFRRLAARASLMKRAAAFSSSREVRVDDLDRDGAPERDLLGAVDAAHAADADQVRDAVAARQRASDERILAGVLGRAPSSAPQAKQKRCASPHGAEHWGQSDILVDQG